MSQPLAILSAGAVTSVGLSLPATSAAIRAALDSFQETQFVAQGETIVGARVPLQALEEADGALAGGTGRLARMVSMAVEECLHGRTNLQGNTALILVLPDESRAMNAQRLARGCEGAVEPLLTLSRQCPPIVVTQGAVGLVTALQEARTLLARGEIRNVLIVGVDSWLNTPSIQEALVQKRLMTQDNSDGFLPGEAAAAILVGSGQGPVRLLGLGGGEEPATVFADEPCNGKGLAKAMGAALKEAGLEPHQVDLRMSNISGEEYFFTEASYAWSRLVRASEPPEREFLLPATRIGEVGATAGLVMMAHAWYLASNHRAPGPHSLINLSSAQTKRGAIVLSLS